MCCDSYLLCHVLLSVDVPPLPCYGLVLVATARFKQQPRIDMLNRPGRERIISAGPQVSAAVQIRAMSASPLLVL